MFSETINYRVFLSLVFCLQCLLKGEEVQWVLLTSLIFGETKVSRPLLQWPKSNLALSFGWDCGIGYDKTILALPHPFPLCRPEFSIAISTAIRELKATATSQTNHGVLPAERAPKANLLLDSLTRLRITPLHSQAGENPTRFNHETGKEQIQETGNSWCCVLCCLRRLFLVLCLHWPPAAGRLSCRSWYFPINIQIVQKEWICRMRQDISKWFPTGKAAQ